MSVLMWDKPKKLKTTDEWANDGGFEGGPIGGYLPNMSKEDEQRWKAKLVGKTTNHPQVEIRKTASTGGQMLLIVSLGNGYTYKHYKPDPTSQDRGYPTKGVNVHMSMNAGVQLTFQDIDDMHSAVAEAKTALEQHVAERAQALLSKIKTR